MCVGTTPSPEQVAWIMAVGGPRQRHLLLLKYFLHVQRQARQKNPVRVDCTAAYPKGTTCRRVPASSRVLGFQEAVETRAVDAKEESEASTTSR